MTSSTLPDQGTAADSALSFNDGVDAITNLFDDSDNDSTLAPKVEAQEDQAEDQTDQPEDGAEDEAAETDEQVDAQDDQDGHEASSGGKFVSNDAKVTLKDGTVTTVEELKRSFFSHQTFVQKTTELKRESETLTQQKSHIGQVAQSLAQQRDFLLQAAQALLPEEPDDSMLDTDPLGYWREKRTFEKRMQVINQLQYQQQAESGRLTEEQLEQEKQHLAYEAERLLEAIPEFRDAKVYQQFWSDATTTMAEVYGIKAEELAQVKNHQVYRAIRDLVKYHKLLKQAPKVKQDVLQKPKMINGGKRMDPKAKISREAQERSDQLRRTGSFDAGVRALEDLI